MPALAIVQQVLPPQDRDAVEIGALYRKGKQSIIDGVRYYLECGHRLIAKKKELKDELGHGHWLPWLKANADALRFDTPRTAQRLMELATEYDVNVAFENLTGAQVRQISQKIWGNQGSNWNQNNSNDHWTPKPYIEAARKVFWGGKIDLDPASCAEANRIVKATKFFTKERIAYATNAAARKSPGQGPGALLFGAYCQAQWMEKR